MSTSVSAAGPVKKMSSCVRPGVCYMHASEQRPVRALIRLDFPTLERPAKAISVPRMGGSEAMDAAALAKCHSATKSLRPASISPRVKRDTLTAPRTSAAIACASATISGTQGPQSQPPRHVQSVCGPGGIVVSLWVPDLCSAGQGRRRSSGTRGWRNPLIFGGLRSANPPCDLSSLLLLGEQRLDVVDKLDLGAMLAHDHALLNDGERVVPCPIDHQPGGEARHHHPAHR